MENNSGYDQVKIVLRSTILHRPSSIHPRLIRLFGLDLESIVPSHQDGEVAQVNVDASLQMGWNSFLFQTFKVRFRREAAIPVPLWVGLSNVGGGIIKGNWD